MRRNLVAFNLVGPAAECHRLEQLNPFGIRQLGAGGSLAVGPGKGKCRVPAPREDEVASWLFSEGVFSCARRYFFAHLAAEIPHSNELRG